MQILLTSHGHLASGIKSSFEFIAGKSSHLMTIELDQDGIGSFQTRLKKIIRAKNRAHPNFSRSERRNTV